ncbi:unnamed protein product, partial [Nesidiocoris tenuis]
MRTTNFDITTSPTLVPWKDLIKCRRKSAVPPRSKKESIRLSLRYLRDELNSRFTPNFCYQNVCVPVLFICALHVSSTMHSPPLPPGRKFKKSVFVSLCPNPGVPTVRHLWGTVRQV